MQRDWKAVALGTATLAPIGGIAASFALQGHRARKLANAIDALRHGENGTAVATKSKRQADELLNAAFPDYRKVRGIGPEDASGARRKTKMDVFKKGGAYHKDYAIDSKTGRVRGHDKTDPSGANPHINIKRRDGKKVRIDIIE